MAWPGWENYTGAAPAAPKRSKYNAQPTTVDNIRFDSKKEAARYSVLQMMDKAGEIHSLTLQPVFPILVTSKAGASVKVGTYRGDFQYCEKGSARPIVEDVKGVRTPVYKLKKKLVEAQYGIEIREV